MVVSQKNLILFCDLKIKNSGHNFAFMQNLINQLDSNINDIKFLVPPDVKSQLVYPSFINESQIIIPSPKDWLRVQSSTTSFTRRQNEWKIICNISKQHSIKNIIILDIDQYQYVIGKSNEIFKISGIYFRPHFRISSHNSPLVKRISLFFWRKKKVLLEKWMCRNPQIQHIYILNDQLAVTKMNSIHHPVFKYLPDPVFPAHNLREINIREKYSISSKKTLFIIFGSMVERKNVVNILHAFSILTPNLSQHACLILAGGVDKIYKTKLMRALSHIKEVNPNVQVVTDFRFIPDDEVEALFAQSDVAILIYKDLYVSSGVLGIAARHNRYSLVSEDGLLGELVDQYQLGQKVAPESIESISRTLSEILSLPSVPSVDGSAYCHDHSPSAFAKTLFCLN